MARAKAEASAAGWRAPAIRIEDGADEGEGEGEDGEDAVQTPIPPSQELSVEVAGFTRRAEHLARSIGSKRRRIDSQSVPGQSDPTPVVPMTTAGFVLAPASATTDPEVLRRLEEMRT